MKTTESKNRVSEEAAHSTLRSFFKNHPDADVLTPAQIYAAAGRSMYTLQKNRKWLANKIWYMRDYNLVEREYVQIKSGGKELIRVSLTPQGRKVLGREQKLKTSEAPLIQDESDVTLETVYRVVEIFREKTPSFEVVFDIKPRGGKT